MSFRSVRLVLAAVVLPAAAAAQPPATGAAGPARGHAMDVSAGTLAAFDTEPFADSAVIVPGTATSGRAYTAARARLAYRFRSPRITFAGAAGSDVQYYPTLAGLVLGQHDASASLGVGLGRRVSMHVSHGSGYSPFVSSMPVGASPDPAADIVSPPPDAAMSRGDTWRHQTDVAVSRRLGRYTQLDASYGRSSFAAAEHSRTDHRAGLRVTRPLSRRTALRAGYFERIVTRGDGRPAARLHEIDAGVDYARALSLSRRTTATFGTGSGVVSDGSGTRLHALGNVAVAHQIGRTWSAQARYNRSLDVLEVADAPVVLDSLSATFGGGVARRMHLSSGATYARANAAGGGEFGLESYHVSARATVTLTRQAGAYAEYFVHSYRVGGAGLLAHLPARRQRHGVRIGLSVAKTLVR